MEHQTYAEAERAARDAFDRYLQATRQGTAQDVILARGEFGRAATYANAVLLREHQTARESLQCSVCERHVLVPSQLDASARCEECQP